MIETPMGVLRAEEICRSGQVLIHIHHSTARALKIQGLGFRFSGSGSYVFCVSDAHTLSLGGRCWGLCPNNHS